MTKRMLIDASHAEETRVVVLDGNRLEDFDVETATKRQLKGNIYLAKVVRVEPSLQAAFVEYGGNRHGFLAFSEIHPDYYQIPVADRQRLIEMEAEEARREEEEADLEAALDQAVPAGTPDASLPDASQNDGFAPEGGQPAQPLVIEAETISGSVETRGAAGEAAAEAFEAPLDLVPEQPAEEAPSWGAPDGSRSAETLPAEPLTPEAAAADVEPAGRDDADEADSFDADSRDAIPDSPPPESVGGDGDSAEERDERRLPSRFLRNYKIQEVIRRRQILLVQVVKEERGTKGAALTTYLSLAGRFSVLMPNSPRGGGISRKITSATDRRRLKEVMTELAIPRGMGLIVRTAGANRPKPEIKRDCEYLLRLWDDIREHTMKSVAPALIYEEASLIKRAIRDVYSRDVDDIQVDGEEGWRAAHEFMRMLMPTHAKKVQLWRDTMPLFARHQVEAQLDAMLLPTVQLRSGGYLVINQAEALVAIDVNSGRSTRERGIEETALRTNMEAADEVARQLRLRDLAGLIVIDFIDMEAKKHNAMVERRMKEALKNDRARIQIGHISHFGLMEMSRQRLRPSLAETSFIACPHCGGTGQVRSTESAAIHVLRGIEDEGSKRRAAEIVVHVATPIALYLLNHKRDRLQEIEARYAMRVIIAADDSQLASEYRIERVRAQIVGEALSVVTPDAPQPALPPPAAAVAEAEADEDETADDEDEDIEDARAEGEEPRSDAAAEGGAKETPEEADRRRKRRRRRRRGRRDDMPAQAVIGAPETGAFGEDAPAGGTETVAGGEASKGEMPKGEMPKGEMPKGEMLEGDTVTGTTPAVAEAGAPATDAAVAETHVEGVPEHAEPLTTAEEEARNRRRGRRGGRRRRREPGEGELTPVAEPGAEQPDLLPVYTGPTPANPFGGHAFDIFDVLEQAERSAAATRAAPEPARAAPATEAATDAAPAQAPIVEPTPIVEPGPIVEPAEIVNASAPEPVAEAAESTPAGETPPLVVDAPAAEAAPAAAKPAAPEASAEPTPEIANAGALEPTTIEPLAPEPAAAEATPPAGPTAEAGGTPDTGASGPAEPVAETATAHAEPEARPAGGLAITSDAATPPVAANDATSEPAIKPIVIGSADAPPVEKKRGWWRR